MVCHGCHLQMGQGAHNGSVPGKDHCTLPHSNSCPGGIVEDASWRACPVGYQFNGQGVPETGFTMSMNMSDFTSSTPNVSHDLSRIHPPPNILPGSLTISTAQPTLTAANVTLSHQVPVLVSQPQVSTGSALGSPPNQPPAISAGPSLAPSSLVSATLSTPGVTTVTSAISDGRQQAIAGLPHYEVDQHIQQQVAALRAANQVATSVSSHDQHTLSIAGLRALPQLSQAVDTHWQQLRASIPALQAAQSAPVSLPAFTRSQHLTGATGSQVQPFPGQVGQHLTGATGNQGQPFPGQVGQVQLGAAAQPIQAVSLPSYTGDTRSQQVITATGYQLGQVQGGAAHPLPAQGHLQPAIGAFPGQATRPLVAQGPPQPAIRVGQVVHSDPPLPVLPKGTYFPSSQVEAQQVQCVQAQNAAPLHPQGQVLSVGIQQHQPVPPQGLHQGLSQQAQLQVSQPYHTGHQVQQVGHQTIQPQSAGQPTPCQGSQHIRGIHHVQHPPYQPVHHYQPGQDLMQQVQYKLEYRCSPTSGKVFQVYVPIQPCHVQHTPIHYEWRCDPRTGETYQVQVKN